MSQGNHLAKYSDLTGQVFGRLTALYYVRTTKGRSAVWRCRCECGQETEPEARALRAGATLSCGCYNKDLTSNRLRKKQSAFNILHSRYIHNAKARGLLFELSIKEFTQLTKANCYYCNAPPSLNIKTPGGDYTYNGIDRLNNSMNYTITNTVSCCKWCNISKNNRDINDFREWAFQLVANLNKGVLRG
jgi:hypothetical protein